MVRKKVGPAATVALFAVCSCAWSPKILQKFNRSAFALFTDPEMVQKRQREPNRESYRSLRNVDYRQNLEEATAAHDSTPPLVSVEIQASATIKAANAMATSSIDQSTISRPRSLPALALF